MPPSQHRRNSSVGGSALKRRSSSKPTADMRSSTASLSRRPSSKPVDKRSSTKALEKRSSTSKPLKHTTSRLSGAFRKRDKAESVATVNEEDPVLVEGHLKKRNDKGIWQERWFVLRGQQLVYYKTRPGEEEQVTSPSLRLTRTPKSPSRGAVINLWKVDAVSLDGCDIHINLSSGRRLKKRNQLLRTVSQLVNSDAPMTAELYILRAKTPAEAQIWVQAMYARPLDGEAPTDQSQQGAWRSLAVHRIKIVNDSKRPSRSSSHRRRKSSLASMPVVAQLVDIESLTSGSTSLKLMDNLKDIPPKGRLCVELSRRGQHSVVAIGSCKLPNFTMKTGVKVQMPVFLDEDVDHPVVVEVDLSVQRIPGDWLKPVFSDVDQGIVLALIPTALTWTVILVVVAKINILVALLVAGLMSVLVMRLVVHHSLLLKSLLAGVGNLVNVNVFEKQQLLVNGVYVVPPASVPSLAKNASTVTVRRLSQGSLVKLRRRSTKTKHHSEDLSITDFEAQNIAALRTSVKNVLDKYEADPELHEIVRNYFDHDFRMVRFLRGNSMDLRKADKQFREAMEWRTSFRPDKLHERFDMPGWLLDYAGTPYFKELTDTNASLRPFFVRDKDGNLATFMRGGPNNWRKVYKKLGNDGETLFKCADWVIERLVAELDAIHQETNGQVSSYITVVIDLKGFALSDQIPLNKAVPLAKKYLSIVTTCYPEFLKRVIVVNTPWLFNSIWSAFTPFLPKELLDKIQILGSKNIRKPIHEHFDVDQIPVMYGGTLVGPEGEPECWDRVSPRGPYLPDKGEKFLR